MWCGKYHCKVTKEIGGSFGGPFGSGAGIVLAAAYGRGDSYCLAFLEFPLHVFCLTTFYPYRRQYKYFDGGGVLIIRVLVAVWLKNHKLCHN